MDSREKYEYWLESAQYDLETAKVMMSGRRYVYVVFMCQQSIEKLAKGLYVLFTNNEPPMIHNIWNIFKQLKKESDILRTIPKDKFEIKLDNYKNFFAELLSYYISGRYPTYKEKISNAIDSNGAKRVLNTTVEVFQWIESLNEYKK